MSIQILLHKVKRADRRLTPVIALGIFLACCPCAFALDPSLDVSQYAHTAWKVGEGLPSGTIRAIAQTPDGYLWLGTEFGLRRFDGVRAVPWEPPAGQHLATSDIRSLQGARDGRLWIGTFRGLASWKDGKLTHYPELDGQVIEALLEDREGTIWVAGWAPSVGRLCRIQGGDIQCYGEDGRFGYGVTPLYEDSGGNIWAGATNGLWQWKPGPPSLYPMPDPAQRIYALAESDDGGILIATHGGVTKLRNGKTEAYPLPAGLQFQPHRLLRDRNGGLWIGALVDSGLLHIHEGKADLFSTANGLSGASVTAIFEDREGSIWVATVDGLDRFREFAITTISVQQGLSSQGLGSILAARDGSIWLGTSEGLNKWNQGQITVYRNRSQRGVRGASQPAGLIVGRGADWKRTVREITDSGLPGRTAESIFEDHRGQIWVGTQSGVAFLKAGRFAPVASVPYGVVHSITGDSAGNLWMSHQEGLFHLLEAGLVERIPWAKLGRREPATAVLHDARQGGVWLGFRDGGVAYFNDGQIRASYAAAEGLGEGMVRTFYTDASGSLWAATDGGLSRIKAGRVQTLTSRNGLPCNMVHWMMEDDADSVWLYTACGLVRIAQSDLDAWASNPKQTIQAAVFDSSDGVRTRRFPGGYSANVAKSADGKLWFLSPGGVSVIDPHHLAFNELPPPVHIEQVTANDKIYDATNGLRLPPLIRNLAIDYTALSFVAPEKVRFRYMLEGQDPDWKEVINDREVQYSNLGPGHYRFRVIASNNSGVWNEQGASLDFSIDPAFYQTNWFGVLVAAAFLSLVWAAYRVRTRQLQRDFKKLRDMIETIPAMVWTALPNGSNEFENRRWTEYTGLAPQDAGAPGWTAAVHPDDRESYREKWRAALAHGEPFECEARFRSAANGEYRWFFARGVPLRDKYGKIVRWYGILADIEDRKQQRERVRQLEADLAHINRVSMMGELAASIAHEVNQPLSGIVSNGSACLRWLASAAPDMEEIREALGDMVRDGKRAGAVIARIRALTRRAEMPSEKLDMNETIIEVLALVGDETKKRQVAVKTQFANDLSPVSGDRVQLQQVVLNVVMNAMEAMSGVDQSRREIVITTQNTDADQVVVSVQDSGMGLDPNAAMKVFEPFYTTKSGGMGMGLSISRSIIQSHGGRLWATSNEGSGATFHFTLPKCRQEA